MRGDHTKLRALLAEPIPPDHDGGNQLEGRHPTDPTWKILLTDEESHRVMCDVEDL